LLARSSRMVVPLLTTTSTRSPPFTWSYVSGKACKSSSRPSLARQPVHGRTAASSTSFPLEEPSHDKSLPRTTSLRLARQVQAPTSTWARAHYSGGATDARGGANLHVTRKQQLAAMQAARPGKSLNAGLTSRVAITSPSSPNLPHARLNPRHSSTFYDAHKPRHRFGRGKLGKHSDRQRQAQTTRGEGQASRKEQSNPDDSFPDKASRLSFITPRQTTTYDGTCQLSSTVTLLYFPLCPSP
jgi:hypothetical protein